MSDVVEHLNSALAGRYTIERELGEGGMAVVYLANDLKHERRVALKVLKPELAAVVGAERFLAEIKTTAHLQHPHILPLFDSGEAAGFLYYVMPYVEGETLRGRLDRERQLPVEVAVRFAADLAEALGHAHAQGVIHRDIKPANILMQGDRPVIADFGIALAVGSAGGSRLTETGLSVGSPYYMSPEQATGDQVIGPPSDVYALGCVLYEMLVGDPPYSGSTAQAVLGKIIAGGPVSARESRPSVPRNVDAAVRMSLEKLPADRFTSAGEFANALRDESFRHRSAGQPGGDPQVDSRWRTGALLAGAVAVVSLLLAGSSALQRETVPDSQVVRFSVPLDGEGDLQLGGVTRARFGRPADRAFDLSPDGTLLVFTGTRRGADGTLVSSLYLRRLDQESASALPGTEGGDVPFFSPDGAWIGFFGDGDLRRWSLETGVVEVLVPDSVVPGVGGAWSTGGEIFIGTTGGRLVRVPQAGGDPTEIVVDSLGPGEEIAHPSPLPGGRRLLFSVLADGFDGGVHVADLDTDRSWVVLEDAMDARFVEPGHLLFMRRGALLAIGFDPDEGQTVGSTVTILEDVAHSISMPNSTVNAGTGQYTLSSRGHLAYVPGGIFPVRERGIVRIEPGGRADTLDIDPREYGRVRVSPDGRKLAVLSDPGGPGSEFHVHDLDRGVTRLLNTGRVSNSAPAWSPDSESLAYRPFGGGGGLQRISANGGDPVPLGIENATSLVEWAPNGDLLFRSGGDLHALTAEGDDVLILESTSRVMYAAVSPDGRWLAYTIDVPGREEVYVGPYPGPGPSTLVSPSGGVAPAWSRDGERLYYRSENGRGGDMILGVDVTLGRSFSAGRPYRVIDPWTYSRSIPLRSWDTAPDGSIYAPTLDPLGDRARWAVRDIQLFLNFAPELTRRLDES